MKGLRICEEQSRKKWRVISGCLVAGTEFFHGPTGGEKALLCGYPKLNITYILETSEGT